MAKVHRVMKPDPLIRNRPKTGSTFGCLGVRVPKDIEPDKDGNVKPSGTKGLSVAPSLQALGIFLVPNKYSNLLEGAVGDDKNCVWLLRDSSFEDGPVAPKLHLTCDAPGHGLIEPASVMSLNDYQTALQETQSSWDEL